MNFVRGKKKDFKYVIREEDEQYLTQHRSAGW